MSAEDEIKDLLSDLGKLVANAYARGFTAGSMAMRENIIQAASAPMAVRPGAVSMAIQVTEADDTADEAAPPAPTPRAPKGLVPAVIRHVLETHPGSTTAEITSMIKIIERRVAAASVGNELRRFDGKLYERDGRKWFLKGQMKSAGESTTTAPAELFHSDERR